MRKPAEPTADRHRRRSKEMAPSKMLSLDAALTLSLGRKVRATT